MPEKPPDDSGAQMIDAGTMARIRTISAVARQLDGITEQLIRVRDSLMAGTKDAGRDDAVVRGAASVLATCALSLRELDPDTDEPNT
jgi:hypothetical protein